MFKKTFLHGANDHQMLRVAGWLGSLESHVCLNAGNSYHHFLLMLVTYL